MRSIDFLSHLQSVLSSADTDRVRQKLETILSTEPNVNSIAAPKRLPRTCEENARACEVWPCNFTVDKALEAKITDRHISSVSSLFLECELFQILYRFHAV